MLAQALAPRQGQPIGAGPRKRQHKIVENNLLIGSIPVDENRLSGTAKKLGGKIEDGLGRVTGDAKTQAQGPLKQAAGDIQDLYGQAIDSAEDGIESAKMTATSAEDTMRDFIENRPYTTAAIALGLGWLIGRSHRPF
ncbi:MAG: CsbD family protein [Xanthobacteraceae bacterium]